MVHNINCAKHGLKEETFVCVHIAESLQTKIPVGFFWSKDDDAKYPDAWCGECNDRVAKTGGEWKGEAKEKLNAKLLCSECYLEARNMALDYC